MGRLKWLGAALLLTSVVMLAVMALRRPETTPKVGKGDESKKTALISQEVDGYQQIFLLSGKKREQLTHRPTNHTDPLTDGQHAVWVEHIDGAGQIALYDLKTRKGIILTKEGTNLHPSLDGTQVVWEGWVNDRWQVFYYNGTETRQLTKGDVAVSPIIAGQFVAFARQGAGRQWRVEKLDLKNNQISLIKQTGIRPSFRLSANGFVELD